MIKTTAQTKQISKSAFDPGALLMIFYTVIVALVVAGSVLTVDSSVQTPADQYSALEKTSEILKK